MRGLGPPLLVGLLLLAAVPAVAAGPEPPTSQTAGPEAPAEQTLGPQTPGSGTVRAPTAEAETNGTPAAGLRADASDWVEADRLVVDLSQARGQTATSLGATLSAEAAVTPLDIGDRSFLLIDTGGDVTRAAALTEDLTARGLPVTTERRMRILGSPPNDPLYDRTWGGALGSETPWTTATGAGTVVAVLDTGVHGTEDLPATRLLPGRWFTADGHATWRDLHDERHGTNTAEAAAATGNNGVGGAGGCWDCLVLPVRVL